MSETTGSGANDAVLLGALKDLNAHWERTASAWRDAAREQFERDYLRELAVSVRTAASAINQIEVLLRQVRKECS
jgi:hypothetical protein